MAEVVANIGGFNQMGVSCHCLARLSSDDPRSHHYFSLFEMSQSIARGRVVNSKKELVTIIASIVLRTSRHSFVWFCKNFPIGRCSAKPENYKTGSFVMCFVVQLDGIQQNKKPKNQVLCFVFCTPDWDGLNDSC